MTDIVTRDPNGRFVDGHAGLGGRPIGSRQAFSAAFLRDLGEVWADHGKTAMLHCARTQPETFFATAARILPKDVAVTIEQAMPRGLEPEDLAILRAIKAAIPDANSRSPDEVLSFVLDAVRAHSAQLIDAPSAPSATDGIATDSDELSNDNNGQSD
jgi:hypothetical protein